MDERTMPHAPSLLLLPTQLDGAVSYMLSDPSKPPSHLVDLGEGSNRYEIICTSSILLFSNVQTLGNHE